MYVYTCECKGALQQEDQMSAWAPKRTPRSLCTTALVALRGLQILWLCVCAGHGKKKNKYQKGDAEEPQGAVVPAVPTKAVPKPYMSDARYVTSEFQTTGMQHCIHALVPEGYMLALDDSHPARNCQLADLHCVTSLTV